MTDHASNSVEELQQLMDTAWANRGKPAEPAPERFTAEEKQAMADDLERRRRDRSTHLLVVFAEGAQDLGVECAWCGDELTCHEQSVSARRLQELAEAHFAALGI